MQRLEHKEELHAFFKQRAELKPYANVDLSMNLDVGNRAAAEITRNRAQERLAEGYEIYKDYVHRHMGLLILQGDLEAQRKFATLAEEVGGVAVVDLDKWYQRFSETPWLSLAGSQSFTVDQMSMVWLEFRSYTRQELNWFRARTPDMYWMLTRAIKSYPQLNDMIRESIRLANGDLPMTLAVHRLVTLQGLEKQIQTSIVPVVIVGASDKQNHNTGEKEVDSLLLLAQGRGVMVSVSNEPTQQEVIDAFKNLKSTFELKLVQTP